MSDDSFIICNTTFFFFFFFQAEDGIRDTSVTGVQTCALPIFKPGPQVIILDQFGDTVPDATNTVTVALGANPSGATLTGRSEERRVGKECRSRRAREH